jgi:hypothetical protein
MMDQAIDLGGPAVMQRLLERIEDEPGQHGTGDPPSHD